MMPAKSCKTCYHCGSLTYGPDCWQASKELCCEDWIAPKVLKVRAVIEGEIDLTALELAYQEEYHDLDAVCQAGGVSKERYILGLLQPDGIEVTDITGIEQLPDEGEGYPVQPVKQREVIIA